MRKFSAILSDAIGAARQLGHTVEDQPKGPVLCTQCGMTGSVSHDPLIEPGESVGKYNHGRVFESECSPVELPTL